MKKTTSGFTIVELLIVIVVIAILAAISIVAYTGIQNRANNSAVQNDLSSAAKALEIYKVDNSSYPDTLVELGAMSSTAPLKASKQAYPGGVIYNYAYCPTSSGSTYGLAARSKSGVDYYVTNSNSSPQVFSSWGTSLTAICPALGGTGAEGFWGYRGDTQVWQTWVTG